MYTKACNKYQQFLTTATALILPFIKIAFPFLIKGDYTSADEIIPTFIIVAVISGYSAFIGNVFYAIKDTKIISISTIVAALTNLLICYPLIKTMGAFGTNIAIIIAFAVNIGIRAIILKRKIGFSICAKDLSISIVWIVLSSTVYANAGILVNIGSFAISAVLALFLFKNDLVGILSSLRTVKK